MRRIPSIYVRNRRAWARLRGDVLARDGYRCTKCKDGNNLVVHHIKPVVLGGNDLPSNLITLCEACHKAWHKDNPTPRPNRGPKPLTPARQAWQTLIKSQLDG